MTAILSSEDKKKQLTNEAGTILLADISLGPGVETTLSRVPAKAFTKKHYSDLINEIRNEAETARSSLEGLSEKEKADLEYETAKRELDEYEGALNRSVNSINWHKTAEAKDKLERARKNRNHHHYMELIDKVWAEFNKGQNK